MAQPVVFTFGAAFNQALARRKQLDQRREEVLSLRQIQLQGLAQKAEADKARQGEFDQRFQQQADAFAAQNLDRDTREERDESLRKLQREQNRQRILALEDERKFRAAHGGVGADQLSREANALRIARLRPRSTGSGGRNQDSAGALFALRKVDKEIEDRAKPVIDDFTGGFPEENEAAFQKATLAYNSFVTTRQGRRITLFADLNEADQRAYDASVSSDLDPDPEPGIGPPQPQPFR